MTPPSSEEEDVVPESEIYANTSPVAVAVAKPKETTMVAAQTGDSPEDGIKAETKLDVVTVLKNLFDAHGVESRDF